MSEIEVFADIACPFTHAGIRAVMDHRRQLGLSQPRLHVRPWPLELVNDGPHSGEHLGREIDALQAGAAPHLFAGFDRSRFPTTTLPALVAELAAYEAGPAHGEAFSLAVRDALWEHGLDVSDPEVLHQLADGLGVVLPDLESDAGVRESWAEGRRRGVVGSPHFFTEGGDFFCPMLDISEQDGSMKVTVDDTGFESFLVAAFG